jgi:hypothetical protein
MTKRVVVALLVGAIGLSLSSGLVAQQNQQVIITIEQSLYLACVPSQITYTIRSTPKNRSPSAH